MVRIWCFDLWNTLVKTKAGIQSYEDVLVQVGVNREIIFPFVRGYCMTKRMSNFEFATHLCGRFNISDVATFKKIVDTLRFENASVEWIGKAQEVLQSLRSDGKEIVLITNSTYPGWVAANSALEISKFFSRTYLSWEQKCSKPRTQIFLDVMRWYPWAQPNQFVMVGDSEESDIAIPRKLGWETIFTEIGVDCVLDE